MTVVMMVVGMRSLARVFFLVAKEREPNSDLKVENNMKKQLTPLLVLLRHSSPLPPSQAF